MMLKKRKFIIGGLVICLALFFLGYMGFMGGMTYYYEVGEFISQGGSADSQTVRVNGLVATDIERDGFDLSFTLLDATGSETSLPVVYHGVVPDSFGAGNQIVVEGKYTDGTFQASAILTKCSSRYEPEKG
jgi:cytochrome c-type biogenesis protein CcmE